MTEVTVGVIGGSGVYAMEQLEQAENVVLSTPWGDPSAAITVGQIEGCGVAFLPRHGLGHRFTPSEVPYLANIYALRSLGVHHLLSVSAVGSLCAEYAPGDFVLIDQFIDRTYRRRQTFFGEGLVAHVPMADPVSAPMVEAVVAAAAELDLHLHQGGTYVCIEGPQFSTRAESELFRQWGAKIVGMTNVTEAKLAREAGMNYACIAMVTDYDCWHPDHEDVDVEQVIRTAQANAQNVRTLVQKAIPRLGKLGASPWRQVLQYAVMTAPAQQSEDARRKTAALFAE